MNSGGVKRKNKTCQKTNYVSEFRNCINRIKTKIRPCLEIYQNKFYISVKLKKKKGRR